MTAFTVLVLMTLTAGSAKLLGLGQIENRLQLVASGDARFDLCCTHD
jgi:hypothetical protein